MGKKELQLGKWGEDIAAAYLGEKGYQITERNVYSVYGEIDLVAIREVDGENKLYFVEVKTRKSTSFGFPEQAVTKSKLIHLWEAGQDYFQKHPELDLPWQIDVISIQIMNSEQKPEIVHFENVRP